MSRAGLECSDNALLMMQLQDILFSQGFGTRRVCSGLVQQGLVKVQVDADLVAVSDPTEIFEPRQLTYTVQGERWVYQSQAFLMLHKPAGFECSHKPGAHPSIYALLPSPLRMRGGGAAAGVQAVGRLDHDTTGLLLLSDEGKFIHRMTSPRHHVPKVYQVRVKHPLDAGQLERLCAGVVLDDDPKPVRAAACSAHSEFDLELTLTEGKYHQVKRMVAAVGNRVDGLHRSRIGALSLPPELLSGQWRWLTEAEVAALTQKVPAPAGPG
jgi:16S rRNA pseudouridine516 synthase